MTNSIKLKSTWIFLLSTSTLFAQNTSPTISKTDSFKTKSAESTKLKSLFSDSKKFQLTSWGVSFSPLVQFGQLGPQNGFNFAFHANNKWSIGIAHLQSRANRGDMNGGVLDKPETAFTALSLEYTPKANSIVHVSFPLLIGSIRRRQENLLNQPAFMPSPIRPDNHHRDNDRDSFGGPKSFGIQAGVNLELNVYKYVKLFTGLNYRLAAGRNSTEDFSGFSGTVGLKLGLFDQKVKKVKNK